MVGSVSFVPPTRNGALDRFFFFLSFFQKKNIRWDFALEPFFQLTTFWNAINLKHVSKFWEYVSLQELGCEMQC